MKKRFDAMARIVCDFLFAMQLCLFALALDLATAASLQHPGGADVTAGEVCFQLQREQARGAFVRFSRAMNRWQRSTRSRLVRLSCRLAQRYPGGSHTAARLTVASVRQSSRTNRRRTPIARRMFPRAAWLAKSPLRSGKTAPRVTGRFQNLFLIF